MKRNIFTAMLLVATLSLLGMSACSDSQGDGNSFQAVEQIELNVGPPTLTFQGASVGDTVRSEFRIRNVSREGAATLRVTGINIAGNSGDFSVDCGDKGSEFSLTPVDPPVACDLVFTPSTRAPQNVTVEVVSNGRGNNTIVVSTLSLQQVIEAVPDRVVFNAREGQTDRRLVKIRNVGSADLQLYGYEITGQADLFTAEYDTDRWGTFTQEAPLVLRPHDDAIGPESDAYKNNELQIFVDYAPETTGSDAATLKIFSDDPATGVYEVALVANSNAPCILVVDGTRVDFGNSSIGEINQKTITVQNCGNAVLTIPTIAPADNTATLSDRNSTAPFIIDTGDARPQATDGTLDTPIEIQPGDIDTFVVGYAPLEETAHSGNLLIHSNDEQSPIVQLDLFGRGVTNQCPNAVAKGTIRGLAVPPSEQVEAAPLQYLILDGNDSIDPDGFIQDYVWEITDRPDGSVAELEPVANEPPESGRRQLFLDLAGRYVVEMTAIDDKNSPSCNVATVTILVTPNEAVHIQLVWNNPEDPDQTDLSGADMDIHFMKMPVGRWFDAPYDNYFANREPFWNPEHPSLDIDDTNGAGPENINLDDPVPCQWYAVGVHYWRAQFGTAYVTTRIFINGGLVFEYPNKPMQRTGDFQDLARIHWPTGEVVLVDEVYPQPPRGQEAPFTVDQRASMLCGTPN